MLQTLVAIERDGLDVRVLTMQFEVPNENFNLEYAARQAAIDYCKTEEGRKIYEYNCSYFNWGDFHMHVPSEFCEKHGFKKLDSEVSDIVVDWDELLVDDSQMDDEDED